MDGHYKFLYDLQTVLEYEIYLMKYCISKLICYGIDSIIGTVE